MQQVLPTLHTNPLTHEPTDKANPLTKPTPHLLHPDTRVGGGSFMHGGTTMTQMQKTSPLDSSLTQGSF